LPKPFYFSSEKKEEEGPFDRLKANGKGDSN
jgi:hypothetical protein